MHLWQSHHSTNCIHKVALYLHPDFRNQVLINEDNVDLYLFDSAYVAFQRERDGTEIIRFATHSAAKACGVDWLPPNVEYSPSVEYVGNICK